MERPAFASTGYPVLLHLQGRVCVVVGGGPVAERKVVNLLEAGAQVTVISPTLTPALMKLKSNDAIAVFSEAYGKETLSALRPFLVFAATDARDINRRIADDARALSILVDVVDSADESDFNSMAAIRRGLLTVALSTGGVSPALAKHLRARLEAAIGAEYITLLAWMADLRPVIKREIPRQQDRRALWDSILESGALDRLRNGDESGAYTIVLEIVNDSGIK
jgi:precorrin-2 dehydrogenase / sirohydrochlorin ferrochelatase